MSYLNSTGDAGLAFTEPLSTWGLSDPLPWKGNVWAKDCFVLFCFLLFNVNILVFEFKSLQHYLTFTLYCYKHTAVALRRKETSWTFPQGKDIWKPLFYVCVCIYIFFKKNYESLTLTIKLCRARGPSQATIQMNTCTLKWLGFYWVSTALISPKTVVSLLVFSYFTLWIYTQE